MASEAGWVGGGKVVFSEDTEGDFRDWPSESLSKLPKIL